MTKELFIEKWKLQSAIGLGSAQLDCSEELKKDLEELFKAELRIQLQEIKEDTKLVIIKTNNVRYEDIINTMNFMKNNLDKRIPLFLINNIDNNEDEMKIEIFNKYDDEALKQLGLKRIDNN